MRRFLLATVAAALVVTACGERESPTEPSVPQPEETFGSTCTVDRFPLLSVGRQIADVFPKGRLRLEALARAGIIKLYWDTCHEAQARRIAVSFIDWMNLKFDAGELPGATDEEVQTLTVTILDGVGIPVTEPATPGGIGVAVYTGEELLLKTADKTALTKIEADAFADGEPRVIVAKRLEDGSKPLDFDKDRQFAPFFDYDATKLSGETTVAHKKLADDKFAVIAFCLFDDFDFYPDNARIGHNQVADDDLPTFELLDPFDLSGEGGLGQELECGNLSQLSFGGFSQPLPGFARDAWRTTRELAKAIFLPHPLSAAAVGFSGPIGGKTTSLSPFGVVDAVDDAGVITNGTVTLGVNPQGQLNAPAGVGVVGLRFEGTGLDGIAHACLCEGWGVGASAVSGYANQSQTPQTANLTLESFTRTATQATSVVRIGSTFRVRHHFTPITATANLYEVQVTVENISEAPLSDVVYRRVVDWDVAPTPFAEFISIVRSGSLTGLTATNNGFASADPLVPVGSIGVPDTPDLTANFFNAGPYDHGAVFDVTLSTISPGGTNTFVMYYGAAPNTLAAKTALRSIGASAISLARPDVSPLDGTPNTFMIGFSGLPGTPLEISEMEPPVILGAPPALRLMQRAGEPHPRNRQ